MSESKRNDGLPEWKNLMHLNGNLLCAIDVETTGLQSHKHDIWQVAVVPLNSQYKPVKGILPFYMDLKPRRPENADPESITRERLVQAVLTGIDADVAADMLQNWFNKLNLPIKKKICPLAQNWCFDREFIIDWLGFFQFDEIFHPWYRDTLCASLYANDRADANAEQVQYPKSNLAFLCSVLKVENVQPHDAYSDAVATAECYRLMLKQLF